MPQVRLIRRWGSHQPGATVDVDNVQARWLVQHAIGTTDGIQAPAQDALAPGGDGADPLVSGDGTRRGPAVVVKGARPDNSALPVPGSPAAGNTGPTESTEAGGEAE